MAIPSPFPYEHELDCFLSRPAGRCQEKVESFYLPGVADRLETFVMQLFGNPRMDDKGLLWEKALGF